MVHLVQTSAKSKLRLIHGTEPKYPCKWGEMTVAKLQELLYWNTYLALIAVVLRVITIATGGDASSVIVNEAVFIVVRLLFWYLLHSTILGAATEGNMPCACARAADGSPSCCCDFCCGCGLTYLAWIQLLAQLGVLVGVLSLVGAISWSSSGVSGGVVALRFIIIAAVLIASGRILFVATGAKKEIAEQSAPATAMAISSV